MSKNNKGHSVKLTADMKILLVIETKGAMGGIGKTLSLSSSVDEVLADGCVLIHMPIYQGYNYSLPVNTPIMLFFSTKQRMYSITIKVKEHVRRENMMYEKVVQIGEATPNQRRNCYRLQCSLPVTVSRSLNNNKEQSQPAEGRMIDFSDGGMLFAANEDITVGEKIILSFELDQAESVEAEALRSVRIEEGDYKHGIAVQFLCKDKKTKERFFKYIMAKQREIIKQASQENQ